MRIRRRLVSSLTTSLRANPQLPRYAQLAGHAPSARAATPAHDHTASRRARASHTPPARRENKSSSITTCTRITHAASVFGVSSQDTKDTKVPRSMAPRLRLPTASPPQSPSYEPITHPTLYAATHATIHLPNAHPRYHLCATPAYATLADATPACAMLHHLLSSIVSHSFHPGPRISSARSPALTHITLWAAHPLSLAS